METKQPTTSFDVEMHRVWNGYVGFLPGPQLVTRSDRGLWEMPVMLVDGETGVMKLAPVPIFTEWFVC